METDAERVRRKLKWLIGMHGIGKIAEKAGMSEGYLKQIVKATKLQDSGKERNLHANARRKIEVAYDLDRGWFDNEEPGSAVIAGKRFSPLALGLAETFDLRCDGMSLEDRSAVRARAIAAIRKGAEPAVSSPAHQGAAHPPARRRASKPTDAPAPRR